MLEPASDARACAALPGAAGFEQAAAAANGPVSGGEQRADPIAMSRMMISIDVAPAKKSRSW
jgi:hypothetical protein